MKYIIGGLVLVYPLVLAIGALTGRIKVTSCCVIADPTKDLRMNPYQDL